MLEDLAETGAAASDLIEYRRLLTERAKRQVEALALYEPLPVQAEFHQCKARARLLRGSNRSGKTLSTAVELARAVTGRDPHGKFPLKDGRAYVIGKDEKHLGEVVYRKLFRAGAFKIVRDRATGRWRAFRPWHHDDAAREREARPAPPLIPPRYVKHTTWKSKGDNVPEKVTLTNGWEIDFFSSLGKPPRGSDLDIVWFDEEIVDSEWYPEMSARLLDRRGRLWWGATPQTGSDRLLELHLRCEQQYEEWEAAGLRPEDEPSAREFFALLEDNPHIDEAQKLELAKDLNEQDYEVRIKGGFAIEASKVFPEFGRGVHGVPYFQIPETWTRYAVTDPGRQVCAVLFAAVPPPDAQIPVGVDHATGDLVWETVGDRLFVLPYDELYLRACDARRYGEAMRLKCQGQEFQAFIIDIHGGRIVDIGSGKSAVEQYSKALQENGVSCVATGHNFAWGSDDVDGGIEAVRAWLRVRDGRPTLLIPGLKDKLPNFLREIERYRYKRDKIGPTDRPEDRGPVHLMACVRYLAMYGPRYVAPKTRRGARPPILKALAAKRARMSKAGPKATFGPQR